MRIWGRGMEVGTGTRARSLSMLLCMNASLAALLADGIYVGGGVILLIVIILVVWLLVRGR